MSILHATHKWRIFPSSPSSIYDIENDVVGGKLMLVSRGVADVMKDVGDGGENVATTQNESKSSFKENFKPL